MTANDFLARDMEARRAIAQDLDATLVVEAAAGTGKTTELVGRMLRVLATGTAAMTEMVAVTFTEKAAGELKLRLRERLEHERARAEIDLAVRRRLDLALETLEDAHVNTIHGFCAELLRERPVEAGVDPLFTVLTEPQAIRLYHKAFDQWLQQTLNDPPDGVRRALRRISALGFGEGADAGPIARLRGVGYQLMQNRDFTAAWHRPVFDRVDRITELVRDLHQLAELSASPTSPRDNLCADLDGVRRLSHQISLEESFGQQDLDAWEARLVDLTRDRGFSRPRKGSGRTYSATVTRADLLAARQRFFDAVQQFKQDADADLAAALQGELIGATARYQQLKTAAGSLDFGDLLAYARTLIRDHREVRQHLQRKCARIFVDEFQDTDPLQAEILLLLAAEDPDETRVDAIRPRPGKLFIVGDPKQAIYRFRGTDVATYWRVSRQIERGGGRVLQLTRSYRSVPEIQRFVNAAFAPEMVANDMMLQPDYVPLSPDRASYRGQPAVVALPVPRPYSNRGMLKVSSWAIEHSLPDAVGAYIAWLVDPANGWTVADTSPDGTEQRVPLEPRHIAVLFRRFVSFKDDVTRAYTSAIEARGIPHLLVGGKSFHGREEVELIRAALAAIEWPDDELSVFATLKGSLFAFDDALLLEFRDRFKTLHPFR
ncbi:MAG: UvrD-helicase domain-containing protein, partial [Acidobacteriaceae bacterium]|nr:UvrD-helicase domain-containing protein [Acidobacteriaceae bacterium]